jgi:hypothetical protein
MVSSFPLMPAPVDPVVKACLLRMAWIFWIQEPPYLPGESRSSF